MEENLHFNIKIQKRKYSFKLNRDEFAPICKKPSVPKYSCLINDNAYTDDSATEYTEEWCEKYRKLCLTNFDINMQYYSSLDQSEFNNELNGYLLRNSQFIEIIDLNNWAGVSGYYMMVLDEYKQVYIGKAIDVKRRIQQHWNKTKPLDRILFPMYDVQNSIFSIDFFRALDTTRIFAWHHTISDDTEKQLTKDFPSKFRCNRINGGVTTGVEALASITKHKN